MIVINVAWAVTFLQGVTVGILVSWITTMVAEHHAKKAADKEDD